MNAPANCLHGSFESAIEYMAVEERQLTFVKISVRCSHCHARAIFQDERDTVHFASHGRNVAIAFTCEATAFQAGGGSA